MRPLLARGMQRHIKLAFVSWRSVVGIRAALKQMAMAVRHRLIHRREALVLMQWKVVLLCQAVSCPNKGGVVGTRLAGKG